MKIEDIWKLVLSYQAAVSAVHEISRSDGYPIYPEEISDFMRLLQSPPWVAYEYQPKEISGILESIENATTEEIKWALTAAARSERFCDGSWEQILKNRRLDPVFERLQELHHA
ncbi:DUF6508 domain-containing protein [Microbulbifer aggregans]|uniref:DUF6508 domain-containing protein n=1 Tax=Microbulbifer aggregans TaxID=1769779 RepID=UPI001CFD0122|nr:DUF6508 domain-containing protein [Microbulbifer aggregans]